MAMVERVVYKEGDVVTIVEPLRVIRVGYLLTKTEAIEAAEKEYSLKIYDFMATILDKPNEFVITEADLRLYNDLLDALSSYWLRLKGYGGKERSVHTEVDESLRGTSGWRVCSKRRVKTGTYSNGGYSGGWDGEPDYQPPYLSNEKSHVLLTIEPTEATKVKEPWAIEIEAVNVRLDGTTTRAGGE